MSQGNWSYPKTWLDLENLTTEDLNAQFAAVLQNASLLGTGSTSDTVADFQVQVAPGGVGSENLPTSAAQEIQELRYQINAIIGNPPPNNFWYTAPQISLASIASTIGAQTSFNRIVSGTSRSNGQPAFLIPALTGTTLTLDCTDAPFVAIINGVQYTQSTNLTVNLSLAPSTNNTAAVAISSLDSNQLFSSLYGEEDQFAAFQWIGGGGGISYFNPRALLMSSVGSNITALSGLNAAFKHGSEYFLGPISADGTSIYYAYRGYFFGSGGNTPIKRGNITDADTITLMKLAYVFFQGGTTNTMFVTYNQPSIQATQPSSPVPGDMWFDTTVSNWKQYNGSAFAVNNSILIGLAISDSTNNVGVRSYDFFNSYSNTNSMSVSGSGTTQLVRGGKCSVYGQLVDFQGTNQNVTLAGNLDPDSGALTGNKPIYLYLSKLGQLFYSDISPYNRSRDLLGCYHPYAPWRCIAALSLGNGSVDLNWDYLDNTRPTNIYLGSYASTDQLYNNTGGSVLYQASLAFNCVIDPRKVTYVDFDVERDVQSYFIAAATGYFGRISMVRTADASEIYRYYFPLPQATGEQFPLSAAFCSFSQFQARSANPYEDVLITLDIGSSNSHSNGLKVTGANLDGVALKVRQT